MERKCNINTTSPAHSLLSRGWGGIPGVVEHPLKFSSFATRMWTLIFTPSACSGRCHFCCPVIIRVQIGDTHQAFLAKDYCILMRYCVNFQLSWPPVRAHAALWDVGLNLSVGKRHVILWSCKLCWMWVLKLSQVCFLFSLCATYTGRLPTVMRLGFNNQRHHSMRRKQI